MDRKIRWGILGLGKIANIFADDLRRSKDSVLYGVASRNIEHAKTFGKKHGSINYFGSYEELALDPEIDVIYIATPHALHYERKTFGYKHT